jgi:glycosyltransferase involved in cell wall biosynthesis
MKICHITTHFWPFLGGLENMVRRLAENQSRKNTVSILTLKHEKNLPNTETKKGVFVQRVESFEVIKDRYRWPQKGFSKALESQNPMVVFTHTRFFITSFLAGRWIRKNKKKIKWIHVEHGQNFVRSENPSIVFLAWLFDQVFGRWVLCSADQVVVLGKKGRDFVQKLAPTQKNITIIPNGVEIPKKIIPIPQKNKALFFGRMIREKGVQEILEAARLAREKKSKWEFELIGAGPMFEKELAPNITWTPALDTEPLQKKIQDCDLVLMPSWSEGHALTTLEAGALGRAILGTAVGENSRIISPDFLVPVGSPRGLFKKLRLLEDNFRTLEQAGRSNRKKVEQHFSAPMLYAAYEKLYQGNTETGRKN